MAASHVGGGGAAIAPSVRLLPTPTHEGRMNASGETALNCNNKLPELGPLGDNYSVNCQCKLVISDDLSCRASLRLTRPTGGLDLLHATIAAMSHG